MDRRYFDSLMRLLVGFPPPLLFSLVFFCLNFAVFRGWILHFLRQLGVELRDLHTLV